jgi:hypothetical protein
MNVQATGAAREEEGRGVCQRRKGRKKEGGSKNNETGGRGGLIGQEEGERRGEVKKEGREGRKKGREEGGKGQASVLRDSHFSFRR